MPLVAKSVIVPHPCATLFALVDAVEDYPDFLPWCSGAEVFERSDRVTRARIDIDYRGLRAAFTTRNAKRPPHEMDLALVDGPFERFEGRWRFAALGEAGCRIELVMDYELASGAMQALLAPVFAHVAQTLVERFVERADALSRGEAAR